jgi:ATP-dependent helicase HrpA
MCKREFLNYLRVREWQDFESQLRQVCKEMEIKLGPPADAGSDFGADADGIHRALLAGLLSHIGLLEERDKKQRGPREYLGARGARFAVFPGSVLHRKNPQFLMAGELVETSRLWARQNAAIKPEWAEQLGAHLVKRTYSEPHWSKKRASVMARERVTLYGVPLVADRLVAFGKVDVALSRELFIRHALVYGEWNSRHRFLDTNRRLLEEAEELEHRARRRDIVVDEHTLFDFYDARVGREVVSGAHFDQWWKQERRQRPELLTFDPEMLTHDTAEVVTEADYPEQWDSGDDGLTFPISYHFEPGAEEDGLTIDVPVATLNRVEADDFSWNVPGLREELVTSLIRSLPKNLRVSFVPAPNKAKEFLAAVPAGEEPLLDALERWLRSTTGVVVTREAWDWSKVAAHLQPTYRVVDDGGTEQARGKDLEALKAPLRSQFEQALEEVATDAGLARSGETTWAFGTLDESATLTRAGHRVTVFPALVDEGVTVGLGVFGSTDEAEARHRLGVRRLLLLALQLPSDTELLDGLSTAERLGLAGTPYGAVAGLLADVRAAVVQGLVDATSPVRSRDAYDALLGTVRATAPDGVRALLAELLWVLDSWRGGDRELSGRAEMTLLPALSDMKAQLERLVRAGFVAEAGPDQLRRYPTYLRALSLRRAALDQGVAAVNRDRALMDRIAELQESYLHQVAALPDGRPPGERLRRVRWMLEELRVSLWAQQLGTAYPISDERVRKALRDT